MKKTQNSAWNPGIETKIPHRLRELETIYHPENVSSGIDEVSQLVLETGLSPEELVVFKPDRLALHELIVRVNADIVIREGDRVEALGINFRKVVHKIMDDYLAPHLDEIEHSFKKLYLQVHDMVNKELSESLFPNTELRTKPKASIFKRLFKLPLFESPKKRLRPGQNTQERQLHVIASFKDRGLNAKDPLLAAMYRSLYRVLGSIISKRAYLGKEHAMLVNLIASHVCSRYGSRIIGKQIDTWVQQAVVAEGYSRIPDAKHPILISLKGSSAAGKSSLRPMLGEMINKLGIEDDGYGTISPDIWRRLLLDYESLGEDFKYAGRLTSYEVIIIDAKLDHYIRGKAQHSNSTPHLVVDRFRFDSFTSEKITRILRNTYARYIDTMYMFFIITPPEETVERGWERGLVRGRFKSVEDFLGHCVEAYTGMPKLLFKYLAHRKPKFIFEFLDNSVPKGNYPTLIARGSQSQMDIFEPIALINLERYQKINVMADSRDKVYPDEKKLSISKNTGFLEQCIVKIDNIRFIDPVSNKTYVSVKSGKFQVSDLALFKSKLNNHDLELLFRELAPALCNTAYSGIE